MVIGCAGGCNMRKVILLVLPIWVICATASHAQEPVSESPIRDLTPPILEKTTAGETQAERRSPIPGSLPPPVPDQAGFIFRGEYLLGRPRSDNQDFVIRNGNGGLAVTGPVESLRYNLGNGFSAELGYRFAGSGLDLDATFGYTYFAASGGSNIAAAPGSALFPTITRPGLIDRVQSASAENSLNINLYDLLLTRRFLIDDRLALRGFGGLRFGEIREGFIANYDGLDARSAKVDTRSRFQGFGPMVGGEAVLAAPRGIHLYMRASGGLLVGDSFNSWIETNDNGNSLYVNAPYDMRKTVSFAGLGVGLGWQYRTISVRCGYDVTEWFGVTERVRLSSDIAQGAINSRSGNVSLDAFFLQFAITF